ncbi:MAG TPA: hypothetical protein VLZ28_05890 [Daejeonella sp.]|nr:hypothetical protein [Daejeonella sp.]
MRTLLILLLFFTYGFNVQCKQSPDARLQEGSANDLTAIKPRSIVALDDKVLETSGLIYFDNSFWTINDSGNKNVLYRIDSKSGLVTTEIVITNAKNIDWEELTQDEDYIYIADIGDNSLVRDEKQIYRLEKAKVSKIVRTGDLESEVIRFTFPDVDGKKMKYDAEALISYNGSLHLFTKDLFVTNHFTIPLSPGVTTANFTESYKSNGQVTGAAINLTNNTLIMVGYLGFGQRLLWEFKNFNNNSLSKSTASHFSLGAVNETGQMEAVCFNEDNQIFLSNESFGGLKQQLWDVPYPSK